MDMSEMSPNWAGLIGFIIACSAAIVIASRSARRMQGVGSFFHGGTKGQHQISLGAYNVTLGAGLAFQMSLGQQYGWAALLQVSSVFVGYALLAWFLRRYIPVEWTQQKNIFAAADRAITQATGARSWFGPTVSAWMLIFFIMVLAFESYVAGNLLLPLLVPGDHPFLAVLISFALLTVATVAAVIGGWRAVLDTDKAQILAVIVVVVMLLATAVVGSESAAASPGPSVIGVSDWTTLAMLCAFAVATQFYSPVNWGIVSHLKTKDQTTTFLVGGALGTLLLGIITLAGVLVSVTPGSTPLQTLLDSLHASWASPGLLGNLGGFIVVIGGVSMILSTADSAILKLVMLAYDNILGRDSKALQNNSKDLGRIRASIIGAFLVAFVPLVILWVTRPQIIFVLVAMVTGLNVLAALTATVPVLHRMEAMSLLRGWVFFTVSLLVCVTSALGLYFAFGGMHTAVMWTSFGALTVSIILCSGLILWATMRQERVLAPATKHRRR